jgi:hypothetical protein
MIPVIHASIRHLDLNEGLEYKNHSIRVTFPMELSTKKGHGRGKTTTSSIVNQFRNHEPRRIRPGYSDCTDFQQ